MNFSKFIFLVSALTLTDVAGRPFSQAFASLGDLNVETEITSDPKSDLKEEVAEEAPDLLRSALIREIGKNYPSARIQLNSEIKWVREPKSWASESVKFIGEDGRGNAHFTLQNSSGYFMAEGWVGFSAWVDARIALKRIHPGDILTSSGFSVRQIDLATGQAHEFRGVILPKTMDLNGLEAIQSILEGQWLVNSAVRKIPDVRRGDSIRVLLKSNDLVLSLSGIAQEPSYLNQPVKVMTVKTKRELRGQLLANGVVEVKL